LVFSTRVGTAQDVNNVGSQRSCVGGQHSCVGDKHGPSASCGGAVALEPPRGFEPLTYSLRAKRALRSPSHGFWADAWMASMVVHHRRPLALVIVTQFVTHRTTVASYPRPASPKACHYAIPSVSRQTTLT